MLHITPYSDGHMTTTSMCVCACMTEADHSLWHNSKSKLFVDYAGTSLGEVSLVGH